MLLPNCCVIVIGTTHDSTRVFLRDALDLLLFLLDLPILCPSILEPDLDLSLRQSKLRSKFCLLPDSDVGTELKLLLQLHPLMIRIHDTVLVSSPRLPCKIQQRLKNIQQLVTLLVLLQLLRSQESEEWSTLCSSPCSTKVKVFTWSARETEDKNKKRLTREDITWRRLTRRVSLSVHGLCYSRLFLRVNPLKRRSSRLWSRCNPWTRSRVEVNCCLMSKLLMHCWVR
jgi:hypothetical protein